MAFILSLLVLVVYFFGFADVADKWQVNFSTVAKSRQLFEFKHWHRQEGRIAGNYYEQYRDLVQFMNRTLAPDQTFFEFINAPFLYFITGREGPELFFYQTHMFQTDPTQQAYLAKLEQLNKTNKVPIVIFKSQTWWGNAVDGVPCEVSCYRLAEYIYRTYRPLGYVGGYQIWVKKDMDTSGRTATIPVAQNFNLMKLPFIWGTYDSMQAATKTPILGEFRMNDAVAEAGKAFALKFDPLLDKTTGNYLHFRLRTREEAMFTVAYGRAPQNTITFSVLPSYDYQDYLVRISSQWNWMNEPIDSILFQASSPVTIDRITIRKGD